MELRVLHEAKMCLSLHVHMPPMTPPTQDVVEFRENFMATLDRKFLHKTGKIQWHRMKDFTFWSNDEEADEIYAADVVEKLLEMKKIFSESYKGDWSMDYQLSKPVHLISIKDKIEAVLKDTKARNRDVSPGRKLNDK